MRIGLLGVFLALAGCHVVLPLGSTGEEPPGSDAALDGPVVTDGPPPAETGPPPTEASPPLPDGPVSDNGPSPDVGQPPPCGSLTPWVPQIEQSTEGDWTLALAPGGQHSPISFASTIKAKQAAAAVDYATEGVAGLVVSRPDTELSAASSMDTAVAAVSAAVGGTVVVPSKSQAPKTHDGYGRAIAVLELTTASQNDVSTLRNQIVAALLGSSTGQLSGLPGPLGSKDTSFVVRLTLVVRADQRSIVVGAVTRTADEKSTTGETRRVAKDLASASGLGRYSAKVADNCRTSNVTLRPVDLIWVLDESGSMVDDLAALSGSVGGALSHASSLGLDLRLGIAGVTKPGGTYAAVGKLCSSASGDPYDLGGTDRFLLPGEAGLIQGCVENPPGYAPAEEWGLANLKAAVQQHLPRGSGPAQIRPNAVLGALVVSDEADNELSSIVSGYETTCPLPGPVQSALDQQLAPYLSYLKGSTDAEARLDTVHVLGRACSASCSSANQPHGYRELSQATGGTVHDSCALGSNPLPALKAMLDDVALLASSFALTKPGVAATVQVELGGKALWSTSATRFSYDAFGNRIRFHGAPPTKGDQVRVSYWYWVSP